MRGTRECRLALGLVLCGVAAGCRTLPGPPSPMDGGLVSSLPLSPERENAAQAHALYSLGIHHELAANYVDALDAYRRASEFDPTNELLALRMASVLVLQHKTAEALRTVEDFLRLNPSSEQTIAWLASFYATTGLPERSLQLFRQLTEQFPANPAGWLQLAAAESRKGNADSAMAVLEAGLSKASPSAGLRAELAGFYMAKMNAADDESARTRWRRKAIDLLSAAAAETAGDPETLYALADLLVRDGKIPDAVGFFENLVRIDPDNPNYVHRLARLHLSNDAPDKAVAVLSGLGHDGSNGFNAQFQLAEFYAEEGNAEKAAQCYRAAAKTAPEDPAPWLKLASLLASQSETLAIAALEEGLRAIPGNPKLLEIMAMIRLGQNRYSQAERLMAQVWETVDENDPETAPSHLFFYNYATVCTHLRQTAAAAGWLRRGMELNPDVLDLYVQRALTGTATYRKSALRALMSLSKMESTEPTAVHAHLGRFLLGDDRPEAAAREFEKAIASAAKSPSKSSVLAPPFYFWFGVALDQSGEYERAVEQFETCIQLDPAFADALNYLAYLWAVRGERLDEALRHVEAALKIEPDNAAFIDTRGWIFFRQGRYGDALAELRRADKIRPDDPEIQDHIRQTIEQLER